METYSKDVVKKLLERAKEKVVEEKNKQIQSLETELKALKLEKELNNEFNSTSKAEEEIDIDKILGGLND